jgi:hypothetical protein
MAINLVKEPSPIKVSDDGKKCWEIKSIKDDVLYKIWAHTYQEALEMLPRIEQF